MILHRLIERDMLTGIYTGNQFSEDIIRGIGIDKSNAYIKYDSVILPISSCLQYIFHIEYAIIKKTKLDNRR